MGDHILEPKESFRYLGSVMHKSGRIEDDVTHRIQLKGKFYRVAIRLAMLYGSECWPLTKVQANRMEVAEMRMLRWTCGKTIFDMIPNGVFRTNLYRQQDERRTFEMVRACQEKTTIPVRRVEALTVDGARRRGARGDLGLGFLLFFMLSGFVLCSFAFVVVRCFSSVRFRCVCLLVATYLILCASLLFALWRCVLFVYACLFGPLLRLFDVDLCARFRCSFLWYVVMLCRLPEVFLEAVPLSSGRGVTVYISPPPYLAYAGLGNVVVVVVVVVKIELLTIEF
ncbi:hypothetical protein Tco_1245601 [Tanacetum coccineum]